MIIDGFDYGDGFTSGTEDNWTDWFGSGEWFPRMPLNLGFVKGRCRRLMTEAEKQAEKAKEGKVEGKGHQVFRDALAKIQAMTDEELERFVQPEVPNIELQNSDWFWYEGSILKCSGRTPYWVQSKVTGKALLGPAFCTKITDPAFIALLEKGAK